MSLRSVPCEVSHLDVLAETLRAEDQAELVACGRNDFRAVLGESAEISEEVWAVFDGDTLLCVFGVTPAGIPWMLSSVHLTKHHMRRCLRYAHSILAGWVNRYGRLFNMVHSENHKPKRWLQWMGFTVSPTPSIVTAAGASFHYFTMSKHDV